MIDILLDSLIDTLKILPFLFLAFLIIEFFEHKINKNNKKFLNNRYSSILGGLLGIIPQCGFSAMVSNLFSNRIVTIGTLIAVYLSTSDEMLPLLISGGIGLDKCIKIVLFKAFIGIFFGFVIDLLFKSKNKFSVKEVNEVCEDSDCACNHSLFLGSMVHTIKIGLFIFIVTFIMGLLYYFVGEDSIKEFLGNNYIFACFIGLIPNCSSSVIISEMYVNDLISLGVMMSGLLTSSGVGLFVLFRCNKNIKENLFVLFLMVSIGLVMGFIIDLLGIVL